MSDIEKAADSGMLGEAGVSGLLVSGGIPQDQPLKQLKGTNAVKVWTEMSRYDSIVAAVLFAIEMLARQAHWWMEAGGDSPRAEEQKDFIEEARNDMSFTWGDTLGEVLGFLAFGWQWSEIVYKRRSGPNRLGASTGTGSRYNDGKIGWRKWAGRAQSTRDRFEFDEDMGVESMIQRDPNSGRVFTIPIEKSLLFRTTVAKGNPEGRSILERSFTDWWFKRRIREIEAIGIERDLAGLPVAWVPASITASGASAADQTRYATFKELVARLRKDEMSGVVMPLAYDENGNKQYDLTLLSAATQGRPIDTNEVLNRYDQRIAASILADFLLLGSNKVGSFALSSDKTELFQVAMNAVLDEVAEVVSRHAIPRLLALNGEPVEEAPMLKHGGVERVNLDELSSYILRLAQSGMLMPDPELEDHLRDVGGLPAVPADVERMPVV